MKLSPTTFRRSPRMWRIVLALALLLGATQLMPDWAGASAGTTRVSISTGGTEANFPCDQPKISGNGRYVVFQSASTSLVGTSTSGVQIYVHDRQTGVTSLESITNAGAAANAACAQAGISDDGRYVVFQSLAGNLDPIDTATNTQDIFLRDRQNGTTKLLSVSSSGGLRNGAVGNCGNPFISDDGQYVAFWCDASNLVASDTNGKGDVFVRDTVTDTTELASLTSSGTQSLTQASNVPRISGDGRYVVFQSLGSEFHPGDSSAIADIFVRDRETGTTTRVSVSSSGVAADAPCTTADISDDGRYVLFLTNSTNLAADPDTNSYADAYMRDTETSTTVRVSLGALGEEPNNTVSGVCVSGAGPRVDFTTAATNLITGHTGGFGDVFERILSSDTTITTTLESVNSSSTQVTGNSQTYAGCLSDDGRFVVFASAAADVVGGDINGVQDIFIRERWDDAEPPYTEITGVPSDWTGDVVTFSLAATDVVDPSPVTWYRLNGGTDTVYTGPVSITDDGVTTIEYWSVDNSGNYEAVRSATARVDRTEPSTEASGVPSDWTNGLVVVTLSADDTGSPIAHIGYWIDGGDEQDYFTYIDFPTDGLFTLKYAAVDLVGNQETTKTTYVRVDRTGPSTVATGVPVGWSSTDVTVTLSATDAHSGVATIGCSLNGGAAQPYTGSVVVSDEGANTLEYWAIDTLGNREDTQTTTILIDKSLPVGVASSASDAWRSTPETVTLSGSDSVSGLASLLYSLDGGSDVACPEGEFSVTAEGVTAVGCAATDRAGNRASGATKNVRIDYHAPVSSASGVPTGWASGDVTVTLSATDTLSGVASFKYSIDGGPEQTSQSEIGVTEEGTTTIEFAGIDVVGNREDTKTAQVRIDRTPPVTTASGVPTGWVGDDVHVTLTAEDALSGPETIKYAIDGGAEQTYDSGIDITSEGTTTIGYAGIDAAGNREATTTVIVRIEKTGPVIGDNAPEDWVSGFATVHVSAEDTGCGMASVLYSIDGSEPTLPYGSSILVTAEGTSTVRYVATDVLGNTSSGLAIVRIDNTAPSGSSDATSTWAIGPVSVHLTATDDGCGLASILYSTDGSEPTLPYGSSITVSAEGTSTVSYRMTDTLGNTAIGSSIVRLDRTAPAGSDDASASWVKDQAVIHLSAEDTGCGVASILYSTDGTTPTVSYDSPITIDAEGTSTLRYEVADNLGNAAGTSKNVRVDQTPPVTLSDAELGYATSATISFDPTDTLSGVAYTEYRLDGGSWIRGAQAVITTAGVYTLDYRSVDNVGNVEDMNTTTFDISIRYDQSAAGIYYRGTWSNVYNTSRYGGYWAQTNGPSPSAAYLSFVGTRVGLVVSRSNNYGIAKITLDGGTPEYVDLYLNRNRHQVRIWQRLGLADVKHSLKIEWTGTDNGYSQNTIIGVDALDMTGTIVPDVDSPSTTDNASSAWRTTPLTVTLTADDTDTWVASTKYKLNGGSSTTYSSPVSVSGEGTSTLQYWSTDGAGNVEATHTATVRIDHTAPIASDDATSAWVHGPVTVHVSADDTGSGLASVLYSTDGFEPTTPYVSGIAVLAEGTTTVRYRATDTLGNTVSKSKTVRIDNTAPTASDDAPSGWVSGPVAVHLTSGDALSGVASVKYSTDGSEPTVSYGTSINVSAEGTTTLRYRVTDVAGNSVSTTTTVRIDNTSPTAADDAPAGWVTGPVTVHLSATDTVSGIASLLYSTDGSTPTVTYSGSVVISAEGTTTLRYKATDAQGHATSASKTVRIDNTPPTASNDAPAGWVSGPVVVHLTSGDTLSGVSSVRYSIDGSEPSLSYGTSVTIVSEGTTTLRYRVTDGASNSTSATATIRVDNGAPIVSDDAPSDWVTEPVTVHLSATDTVSGIASLVYSTDGSTPTVTYSGSIVISTEGTTTLRYMATDAEGHATSASKSVRIDSDAPTASNDAAAGWVGGPVAVHLTTADAVSGVSSVKYSTDGSDPSTDYGTSIDVSAEGTTTLRYRVTDVAGNSASATTTVRIDNDAPTVSDDSPGGWTHAPVTVHLNATDTVSGVFSLVYSTDGSTPTVTYSGSIPVSAEGTTTLRYTATDVRGLETSVTKVVRIDSDAPTASDDAPEEWVNGPVVVHLTTADAVSGLSSVKFSIDGSEPGTDYGSSITVSAEGTTTLRYTVTDVAGNSTSATATVRVDNGSPVVSDDAPSGWVTGPVTVHLNATDTVSGIASLLYSTEGSTPTVTYSGSIVISDEGTTTLRYTATDVQGHATSVTKAVRIDNTAPTASDDAPAGWVGGPVTVHLTSSDSLSGVANVEYSIDGSNPSLSYGAGIMVSAEGMTTLRYRVTDSAGNSVSATTAVGIDNGPPVVVSDAPSGWVTATVTVHFTSEATSGVASTFYSIDGSDPTVPYSSGILVTDEGTTTVRYRATTFGGNSTTATATVRIDRTNPVTTDDAPGGWQADTVIVHVSAGDSLSGIDESYYSVDGSFPSIPATPETPVSTEGTTTLRYRSTDKAGNAESVKTATVRIDRTAPVTTSNTSPSYTSTATISLLATDAMSGVSTTHYRLDSDTWSVGTTMTTINCGTHTLQWYSTDAVGNVESIKSATFDVVKRYEQTDPRFVYRSAWATGTSAAYSGNSLTISNATSATAYLDFTGTKVDLYGSKTPAYGIMRVTLDGTPAMVDLYNAAYLHKQKVFSASELANTTHRLRIEWTGSKNSSATATSVNFDAADLVGTPVADSTAPVSACDASSTWRATSATVTLTATDADTYVKTTYYRLNGASSTTYNAPFSLSDEGTTTLEYWSVDGAGNTEGVKTATVRIDKSAPVTTDDAPTGWVRDAVTVHLVASDPFSGVDKTYYSLDGTDPSVVATSGIVISAAGTTTVSYCSVDSVGNTEGVKTAIVRIDESAPVTTDDAPAGWQDAPVILHLSAVDTISGVATTTYALNGGTATAYPTEGVSISTEGTNTIRYRSTDAADNTESTKTVTIKIDDTAPVTTSNTSPSYTSTATISLLATDAMSGVSTTHYRLDSDTWSVGTTMTTINCGTHTLQWYSTDAVGNVESIKSATFDVVKRYEQTDPRFVYRSAWATGTSAAYSGNSLTISNATSATAYLDFTGTKVDLYGSKTPAYGIMRVTLDGTPAMVDLYNAAYLHKQKVFSASELANTTHRLRIEWTGSKNSSATATSVNFDAADLVGTPVADSTAPVSACDASSTWRATSATVTLTATDADTYVKTTYYRLNGASSTTYNAPFSLSDEGTTTLEYWSVDGAGNTEGVKTATVRIDKSAPVTTDDAPTGWVRDAVTVHLVASDPFSGVDKTYYSLDGTDPSVVATSGIVISAAGTTTVSYCSVDSVGNTEGVKTAIVRIDESAPVTTDDAPAGWVRDAVTVHLVASDPFSGVDKTYYSLDGTDPSVVATSGTVISAEGTTTVSYCSVDSVGNTEGVKTAIVRIDESAPVTTDDAPTGWVSSPISVTLHASDDLSGAPSILYSIDGSQPGLPYSGPISVAAEGTTTILYLASDAAGNQSPVRAAVVRIDSTPPSTVDNAASTWVTGPAVVILSATDGGSGAGVTYYRLNSGETSTCSGPVTVSDEGTTTLEYWSVDGAGNTEGVKTAIVRIDESAPVTTDDAPAGWVRDAVTVHLVASDPFSGVDKTYYSLDGTDPSVVATSGTVISAEGTTTVSYCSVDSVGNTEGVKTATVRIDESAPVTTDDAPTGWVRDAVTVHLVASDPFSGVDKTYYSLDGTDPSVVATSGTVISAAGTTTVSYCSVDSVGNTEGVKTAIVRIDESAPVTTDDAPAGWQDAPVILHLSAVDTISGVATTTYALNGGTATAYPTEGVSISTEGTNTIRYRSTDAADNTESTKTVTIKIDDTAPVTTSNTSPSYTSTATISLLATDAMSGVSTTHYRLDSDTWSVGTTMTTINCGTHTLQWYSTDAVGNVESIKSATFDVVKRYEQTDPRFVYRSAWATGTSAAYSGNSLTISNATSATAYLDFTGTKVDLYGSKTPAYGIMRVTLDGTPAMVDLYNAAYLHKQKVFSASELANTTHRLRIEWTGSKNSSATATSVNFDAADLVGTPVADSTAPVSACDASSTWRATSATVTLTATDADTYVKTTYYRLNGASSTTYNAPFSLSDEGTTTLEYWSVDGAGNTEGVKTAIVRIDESAPVTTDDAPTGWVSSPISVTLHASDDLSGAPSILYSIDGSQPGLPYSGPISVAAEGTTTILYLASDAAGNQSPVRAAVVRIDSTPPSTVDNAASTWVTGPAVVILSATDGGSGAGVTYYRLNSGETSTCSGPVTVSDEGTTTLEYWSVDGAGNTEGVKTATVRIDNGKPTVGSDCALSYVESATVRVAATDTLSGVASIAYRFDGSAWSTGSVATTTTGGSHTLEYFAIDAAGNRSQSATDSLVIRKIREDADPSIGYQNSWSTISNSSASGGAYKLTNNAGATVHLAFVGTGISLYALKYASGGIARVSVDGGPWSDVDMYAPSYRHRELAFTASDLTDGPHTLRMEWTGRKNISSNNAYITLDSVEVAGELRTSAAYDDSFPYLIYGENWATISADAASNGAYKLTNNAAASTDIAFVGTDISLYALKYASGGIARVCVDGGAWTDVDLYAPSYRHKQKVFIASALASGSHTLRLEWTGRKNASANNTYVSLDYVEVSGYLTSQRVDQTCAEVLHEGSWSTLTNSLAHGGSYRNSNAASASINLAFTGTSIDWITMKLASGGIARVSVDGGEWAAVDLYATTYQYKQKVWGTSGLSDGPHTLRIERTTNKNPASGGTYITSDAFDVVGVVTRRRYDQDAAEIHLESVWATMTAASAVGGSYRLANASDSAVDIAFNGTGADVLALKYASGGIARVSVDGGPPVDVDLYAPVYQYRQKVFSVNGLISGTHTVRLAWTGQKNGSSNGTYVNLDAVDVGGLLVQASAPPNPKIRSQEDSAGIVYSETWNSHTNALCSGGAYRGTNAAGASITATFTGTAVDWIAMKYSGGGIGRVSVDGGAWSDVDLYAPTYTYLQRVWSVAGLPHGNHTLVIEWTGRRNAAAASTYLTIDALDADGPLGP